MATNTGQKYRKITYYGANTTFLHLNFYQRLCAILHARLFLHSFDPL